MTALQDRSSAATNLAANCEGILGKIATTSALVLMTKRNRPKIHVDIVGLRSHRQKKEECYSVIARSDGPDPLHVAYDRKLIEPRGMRDNLYYQHILNTQGKQDFCLVPHIEEFLEKWSKEWSFLEPHPYKAPTFYKSKLIVAIKGPALGALTAEDLPEERIFLPYDGDSLLGFISADSQHYSVFDAEWDLDILQQAASDAYDALCLYYRIFAAGKFNRLRVV